MPSEYREERLVRVLQEQLHENIEGVQEAVIVTHDGLVVAAYPGAGQDAPSQPDSGDGAARDEHRSAPVRPGGCGR